MSGSAVKNLQKDREDADAKVSSPAEKKSQGGRHEIDDLFAGKKVKKRDKQEAETAAAIAKQQQLAEKRQKTGKKSRQRLDKGLHDGDEWVDDGLGGVYNKEGFTGRVEDGVRVFKAHLLRKPQSGGTPDCPFDCDCCFI